MFPFFLDGFFSLSVPLLLVWFHSPQIAVASIICSHSHIQYTVFFFQHVKCNPERFDYIHFVLYFTDTYFFLCSINVQSLKERKREREIKRAR